MLLPVPEALYHPSFLLSFFFFWRSLLIVAIAFQIYFEFIVKKKTMLYLSSFKIFVDAAGVAGCLP
jgi:hypothetical protein